MNRIAPFALILLAACSYQGGPTLVGTVESDGFALTEAGHKRVEHLNIRINGWDEPVEVDQSSRFSVDALPTGEVTIEIEIDGIAGSITLQDVRDNELIDVRVKYKHNSVTIRIMRRELREFDDDGDSDSDSDGNLP